MTPRRGPGTGMPPWLYGWFALDAVLALAPPLHWANTGDRFDGARFDGAIGVAVTP